MLLTSGAPAERKREIHFADDHWQKKGRRRVNKQVMASNSVSTGEKLLALIDDIELISK
jgi:hypothetical protein